MEEKDKTQASEVAQMYEKRLEAINESDHIEEIKELDVKINELEQELESLYRQQPEISAESKRSNFFAVGAILRYHKLNDPYFKLDKKNDSVELDELDNILDSISASEIRMGEMQKTIEYLDQQIDAELEALDD